MTERKKINRVARLIISGRVYSQTVMEYLTASRVYRHFVMVMVSLH